MSFSPDELRRYGRHLILPEIGEAGQAALKEGSVAIVGVGGLGSPAALYLGAAGVGRLGLIDADLVDESNLQRQIIHATEDVGRRKTESGADALGAINPHVEVVRHDGRLTSENALQVLGGYDVVIDASDNFPTRYLVNDACVLLGKPNVYGSIHRFEGQASVFASAEGPCYRCIFREPPPPGLVPSCAEAGVLGVLPGIIGSVQALEAIKLITGIGETLAGRLQLFDALRFRWRELRIRKDPGCPVCGEHPTLRELIDYEVFCGLEPAASAGDSITADELRDRILAGETLQIVDVREPYEWRAENLADIGAVSIPMGEFAERLTELDPAKETVLVCSVGSRSARAAEMLRDAGFPRARNLTGGMEAYCRPATAV